MTASRITLRSSSRGDRKPPPLSREDERRLAVRARDGEEEAIRRLVSCHMGAVVRIAQRYRNKGVPLEDLIEEGVLGLLQAMERFDPDRETKFLTYAVWWVRRAIIRCLAQSACLVRVPRYRSRQFKDARKARARLATRLGREPRAQEVAEELGCAPQEAARRLQSYPRSVSLDQPLDGWDRPFSQVFEDPDQETQEESLLRGEALDRLADCFRKIPKRERFVLRHRFGLGGTPVRTLKDLAGEMEISKERVRQLEMQGRNRIARMLGLDVRN